MTDPAPTSPAPAPAPRRGRGRVSRRRAWRGAALSLLLTLCVTLPLVLAAILLGGLAISGKPVALPGPLAARLEARAGAMLGPDLGLVTRGGYQISVTDGLAPQLRARGISIAAPGQEPLVQARELRVVLDPVALIRGRTAPRELLLGGAEIVLRRDASGQIVTGLPGGAPPVAPALPDSITPVLTALRGVMARPELAALRQIGILGARIELRDLALNRRYALDQGQLYIRREGGQVRLTSQGALSEFAPSVGASEGMRPAGRMQISAQMDEASPAAQVAVTLEGLPAPILAAQAPALGWLALMDAPVSGAVEGRVDAAGQVAPVRLALSAGAGQIVPGGGVRPIALKSGQARLSYDPASLRLTLEDLSLDSRALRLRAEGHASIDQSGADDPGGAAALIGQLRLRNIEADPDGVFETPARFDSGSADLRLLPDPLRLDIGSLSLVRGAERLSATGQLRAGEGGWSAALDFSAGQVALDQLLALWPVGVAPVTRRWLTENVTTGLLQEARGALRLLPGAEPVVDLSYGFSGAEVRVVRSLPLIEDGAGYATLRDNAHVLVVTRGRLTPPGGYGSVEVAGTELSVADIRVRPPQAHVALRIKAPIPAALALLDQPPFEIMKKGGRQPDMAQGQADLLARIDLPFVTKPAPGDVRFDIDGRLTDVSSPVLVRGKVLRSPLFHLRADAEDGLRIGGTGTLDGAPFTGEWVQLFGARGKGRSHVSGQIGISPDSLRALKITLPPGLLAGQGEGQLELELRKGQEARFTFTSDLRGLKLALPQLGWVKGAGTRGSLKASGTAPKRGVIAPPKIEAFSLSAPGLSAAGSLRLNSKEAGGGLNRADLDRVTVGDWFDGSVILRGRGEDVPPEVEITGGRADLTRAPFRDGARAQGTGDSYRLRLDRLTVTRGLYLTGLRGEISTARGVSGAFSGRLKGRGPVTGTLSPGPGGRVAVRLRSDDAASVLVALGLPDRMSGGRLDLSLTPARGKAGHYDATALIRDIRVRGIPTLGQALSLGKAEAAKRALNGPGLLFSSIEASLRITPEAIEITRAIGTSSELGITTAGLYLPGSKALHLKGDLVPGGENPRDASFAFAYKLGGTATAPELTVNPASILAPGALRDAFRRRPLTLEDVRIRN